MSEVVRSFFSFFLPSLDFSPLSELCFIAHSLLLGSGRVGGRFIFPSQLPPFPPFQSPHPPPSSFFFKERVRFFRSRIGFPFLSFYATKLSPLGSPSIPPPPTRASSSSSRTFPSDCVRSLIPFLFLFHVLFSDRNSSLQRSSFLVSFPLNSFSTKPWSFSTIG